MLIATVGHIDHGKTSLIRALCGADTDRLPEEKARGISIDLGFAYWRPDDGDTIGFIDVPGHERYIRNMLAGVGGIDGALLVVAADDGVMPQTVEHVAMLDMLGVGSALVAITKCDRVDAERIARVRAAATELLADTSLAGARFFEVSNSSGAGVEALRQALVGLRDAMGARGDAGHGFRMAIDRAFSVSGAGTVVTGTVLAGRLHPGDHLMLAPRGIEVRVRGLQSGGRKVERIGVGERCAVNLSGIELSDVRRGDWLVPAGMDKSTGRLDVWLTAHQAPLRHLLPVRLHHGTAAIPARILIPKQGRIAPGDSALVQLTLAQPTLALCGDRFVLRDAGGVTLLGGGTVVDPFAPADRRRQIARAPVTEALRKGEAEKALTDLLAIAEHELDIPHFIRIFNLLPDTSQTLLDSHHVVRLGKGGAIGLPAARVAGLEETVSRLLSEFHLAKPEVGGLTHRELRLRLAASGLTVSTEALEAILRRLIERRAIEQAGAMLRLPGHVATFSAAERDMWHRLEPWMEQRGARPFSLADAVRELRGSEGAVRAMLYRRRMNGDLWHLSDSRFLLREHVAGLAACAAMVAQERIAAGEAGFSAAQFRDASRIGRNMVIVVLEFLDSIGVTSRRGDLRIIRPDYKAITGEAEPWTRAC